jgi:aquaporin TIP
MSSTDYLWKALISEFLGTFTLVFIGAGSVALTAAQGGSLLGSAFAFGLALMSLWYALGPYSGAHFNPAVSFGFAVAGRMNWGLMLGYWVAQLLGGIVAAALIAYIFGTASGAGASIGSLTNTDAWKAILLEALLTFFLVMVILFVTHNPMLAIVSGIAVGLVLTFDMLAGFPLTGASMNPARSLGPAIFSNNMGTYWIYIVGPLLGALVAALVYKLFTVDFSCCTKVDDCGKPVLDECGRPLKECKRPLVDNCGNPIKDCHGKVQYETVTKHERILTHHQENWLSTAGEWMSGHGFDPKYLKQELHHAMEKVVPGGVVENPQVVVKEVIEAITPQTTTVQIMTQPSAVPGYVTVPSMQGMSPMSTQGMQTVQVPTVQGMRTVQVPSMASPLVI